MAWAEAGSQGEAPPQAPHGRHVFILPLPEHGWLPRTRLGQQLSLPGRGRAAGGGLLPGFGACAGGAPSAVSSGCTGGERPPSLFPLARPPRVGVHSFLTLSAPPARLTARVSRRPAGPGQVGGGASRGEGGTRAPGAGRGWPGVSTAGDRDRSAAWPGPAPRSPPGGAAVRTRAGPQGCRPAGSCLAQSAAAGRGGATRAGRLPLQ